MMDYTTLLGVAEAWSSEDDWGTRVIRVSTLRDIASALLAGDSPTALANHGGHVANDCLRARCDLIIPFIVSRDKYLMKSLRDMLAAGRCPACGNHVGYHAEDCDL